MYGREQTRAEGKVRRLKQMDVGACVGASAHWLSSIYSTLCKKSSDVAQWPRVSCPHTQTLSPPAAWTFKSSPGRLTTKMSRELSRVHSQERIKAPQGQWSSDVCVLPGYQHRLSHLRPPCSFCGGDLYSLLPTLARPAYASASASSTSPTTSLLHPHEHWYPKPAWP